MLDNLFIRPEYIQHIIPAFIDALTTLWKYNKELIYDCAILMKAVTSLLTKYYLFKNIVLIYQYQIN